MNYVACDSSIIFSIYFISINHICLTSHCLNLGWLKDPATPSLEHPSPSLLFFFRHLATAHHCYSSDFPPRCHCPLCFQPLSPSPCHCRLAATHHRHLLPFSFFSLLHLLPNRCNRLLSFTTTKPSPCGCPSSPSAAYCRPLPSAAAAATLSQSTIISHYSWAKTFWPTSYAHYHWPLLPTETN